MVDFATASQIDDISTITVMLWIKPDNGTTAVMMLADKTSGAASGWRFQLSAIGGEPTTLALVSFRATTVGIWNSSTKINLGEWSHITVTYDSGSVNNDPIFYIAGVDAGESEFQTPVGAQGSDSGVDLSVGNKKGGASPVIGQVADIRIYDSILAVNTIADIAAKRSFRLGAPFPVFRCKFIGASGLQVYEGATLAAGNKLVDDIQGVLGTPANSPTGRDDVLLAYQG